MSRRGRRSEPEAPDLTSSLADLAERIGDRIGSGIARALTAAAPPPARAAPRVVRKEAATCGREGCRRPVAAKGLCKSHYNLMLYHRRKAQADPRAAPRRRRRT